MKKGVILRWVWLDVDWPYDLVTNHATKGQLQKPTTAPLLVAHLRCCIVIPWDRRNWGLSR